jgi:hypothetical protein
LHATPRLNRLRGTKPIGAKRWRCVGNTLKRVDAVGDAATHLAIPSVDNLIHVFISFEALVSLDRQLAVAGELVLIVSRGSALHIHLSLSSNLRPAPILLEFNDWPPD